MRPYIYVRGAAGSNQVLNDLWRGDVDIELWNEVLVEITIKDVRLVEKK